MIVTSLLQKSVQVVATAARVPLSLAGRVLQRSRPASGSRSAGGARPSAPPNRAPDLEADRAAIVEAVRERQPDVGELADPDLDVAEVQAQLQAKHAIEERLEAERAERAEKAERRGRGSAGG